MDHPLEPQECTYILPYEAWEAILDKVTSMEDVYSCYQVCMDWRNIILAGVGKPTLLLHKVIPLIWAKYEELYVSTRDMYQCRLVCHKWREIVDSTPTFTSPTFNWEIHYQRNPEDNKLRHFDTLVRSPNPKLNLLHGDSQFCTVMNLKFDPCLTKTLKYQIYLRNCFQPGTTYFDEILYSNPIKKWGLTYGPAEPVGITAAKMLTSLFHNFPFLKCLTLHVAVNLGVGVVNGLEEMVLESLEGLRRENKIRLDSLVEVTFEEDNRVAFPPATFLPFPRAISALIMSAPRLQKVTWWSPTGQLDEGYETRLSMALSAVASSPVKHLEVRNWAEELHLEKLVRNPWPLAVLTIKFNRFCTTSVVHLFLRILSQFSDSLEELHLVSLVPLCKDRISSPGCSSTPEKVGISRYCYCNFIWDRYESYEQVPEFEQVCRVDGQRKFTKLRILSIAHEIFHPVIFPGVMAACPNISQLRIDNEDEFGAVPKRWSTYLRDKKEIHSLIAQLWEEAPPTLELILIVKWKGRKSDFCYRRKHTGFERESNEILLPPVKTLSDEF